MNTKLITNNKKAYHDYFVLEKYECGIELKGTEVKSLSLSNCSIKESLCRIIGGECFVIGMNIRGTKDLLGNNRGVLVNNLDEMIKKIIDFEKHPYQIDNFNLDEYKIENVFSEVKNIVNKYLEKKIK